MEDYDCIVCGSPLDVWEQEEGLRTGVFMCSACANGDSESEDYNFKAKVGYYDND